ncbi:MAG: MFS transporter [Clostridia bacterium]|nr:MFS transporter [Clostridia bacterium]
MHLPQTKREINHLALLFTLTYMVSYITRINYGAVISEMERETGIARDLLSLALTGSFVTYGVGQIVSGILGDRVSPKRLMSYGFVLTVCMNLLIPLCGNPYLMLGIWCVNGFAQSFMWPPLVRLMTALLSEEDYKRVTVKVSFGSSLGTMLIYLISPLIISLSGWRAVFIFSALCGAVMLFFWHKYSYEIDLQPRTRTPKAQGGHSGLFSPLMLALMVAIVMQGMLKDGVTTWMPTYISETYNLSNIIAILTGVILPIFSMICFEVSSRLYRKTITNAVLCAGVIFGVGALAAFGLYGVTGASAAASVVLSALLTGCMHGVNLMLVCMVPAFFKRQGMVSTASGVINACTYVGSAASSYGIARLSQEIGWHATVLVWGLIAVVGTAICLLAAKPWQRFTEKE